MVFQPDIQLEAGTPVIEADSSGQFPLLSYEDYQQGLGGVSDGSSSVIISLTDGTGATGQQIRYLCQAADEESLSGNPETTMQSDYRIQNGELYLTGDCGETWISAGLSEAQLQETLETYHMGNILAQDSFYADGSGTYMFFYGKIPTLKITEDSGSTWREITFDREMPRTVTRRIIRFLDDETGMRHWEQTGLWVREKRCFSIGPMTAVRRGKNWNFLPWTDKCLAALHLQIHR